MGCIFHFYKTFVFSALLAAAWGIYFDLGAPGLFSVNFSSVCSSSTRSHTWTELSVKKFFICAALQRKNQNLRFPPCRAASPVQTSGRVREVGLQSEVCSKPYPGMGQGRLIEDCGENNAHSH